MARRRPSNGLPPVGMDRENLPPPSVRLEATVTPSLVRASTTPPATRFSPPLKSRRVPSMTRGSGALATGAHFFGVTLAACSCGLRALARQPAALAAAAAERRRGATPYRKGVTA